MSKDLLVVLGLLASSGVIGTVVGRYVRPKLTPREELAEVRADRDEDRARLERVEATQRTLLDYVHALREHIVEEKPPPPPPWPDGLRL